MKNAFKRIAVITLSVIMATSYMPTSASAKNADSGKTMVTIKADNSSPNNYDPSKDNFLNDYAADVFGLKDTTAKAKIRRAPRQVKDAKSQKIISDCIDYLKTEVDKINQNGGNTAVRYLVSNSGYDSVTTAQASNIGTIAAQQFQEKYLDTIYWCSGIQIVYSTKSISFHFIIDKPYRVDDNPTTLDIEHTKQVTSKIENAKKNADKVISDNASLDDYHKIKAYVDYIANHNVYNDEAAKHLNEYQWTHKNYGAWSLVYVFDEDESTNVVCEGYAKAFQFLIDNSSFTDKSISSIIVRGTKHMWNVVSIGGKNYMVDATWYDSLDYDKDYLLGSSAMQKDDAHTYTDDTKSFYDASELKLSNTAYEVPEAIELTPPKDAEAVGPYGAKLYDPDSTEEDKWNFDFQSDFVRANGSPVSGSWSVESGDYTQIMNKSVKTIVMKFNPNDNTKDYKRLTVPFTVKFNPKKHISVVIDSATINAGEKTPALKWHIKDKSDLVDGDSENDLNVKITSDRPDDLDKAGTYTLTGSSSSPYYNVSFNSDATLTVKEKVLKTPVFTKEPSIKALTYGDRLSASDIVAGSSDVKGSYSFSDNTDTVSVLKAGKGHSAKIIFTPDDKDYKVVTFNKTFTVNPKKITATIQTPDPITEGDTIPETFDFTVDDNALVSPDTKADLKMTFKAEKKSGSRDYTITGTANNPNYEVTVNPATLTVNAKPDVTPVLTIPDRSVTYGASISDTLLADASATYDGASVPGTFSFTKSYGTLTAGTHALDVKFTPNGSGYTETAGKLKLTVNKKPIAITINNAFITAGDKTPAFSFKANDNDFVNGDKSSVIKVDYTVNGDTSKAGTYQITGTATADNYAVTVNPGTLTVNPKTKVNPVITKKPSLSLTYGDNLAGKTLSGTATYGSNPISGTFAFADDVNTSEILSAGKHTINAVFTPKDTDTYNAVKTTVEVTVAKRQITVVIDDKTKTEGEADPAFTKKVTGSFVGTDNIDDFLTVSRAAGETAGTYAIKGTVKNSSNYDIKVTIGTLTIKAKPVEKAKDVTISSDPKVTVTYGDKLSTAAVTEGTAVYNDTAVAGTWKITTPDKTINKSNATQKVTVTFTPDDTKKYNSTTVQVTPDILKRKITVRADNITRTVGEKKSLTFKITDGSLISGDSESDLAVTLTSSNTSDTAGDYTISGNSASQYYDVTVELGTLTIKSKEKVTPAISTKPSIKITYGEKISNDKITKGAARDGSRTVKGTFTIAENVDTDKLLTAGTHTVKAVFTPDDKSAYNTVETEITVTVAKKHISITIDDKTKTEDEADPTFTKKVTGDFVGNDNIDDFLTISRRAGEAAGKYAITGTVKNADNYDITVTDGVLTINAKPEEKPAAATVQTAPVLTVTYGDRLSSASITNGSVISDGNAVTGTWKITTSDRVVNKSNASRKVTLTFTPSDTKKYSSVSVDVTPTVEKRKITVKADDITRTVGESKSLTYKITNGSLASGDTESDLKVTLRSSNTSDTAGTYVISGTADVDYYDVTIQNGTLTINAKSSDSGSTSGGSTPGGQTGGNSGNTSGGSGSGSGSSSSDNPSNPSGTTVTTYSITYDLNGGTATGNPSSYRNDSNPITLTTPARTGYTFTGWTGSNGNTPQTTVTIRKGTTGNLYFVANWQDNNSANNSSTPADTGTYKISYNLNGGTVNRSNPVSYTVNDTYLINNPWREGYFFAGWTSNLSSVPQMVVTIPRRTTGDITFTATWTVDTSNHATADSDDNTNANTQTDDDGWTEWINGNDDSDIPDIPSTSITKTSSNKKSVTMKFKKTSISGYTVKYQAAIKKANTGGWKKSFVSKTSKTFKGLKKKTTYWVSVRPYITVDGTRYFGDWAKTKIRKTR